MSMEKQAAPFIPNAERERIGLPKIMSERDKKELKERIEAMSPDEWEVVVEAIPVKYCIGRIHKELDKAAEMQKSIERAYAMVKQ